jgi:hypothetical protein
MSTLDAIWDGIQFSWWLLFTAVPFVLLVALVIRDFYRGTAFIARVIYEGGGYLPAGFALLGIYLRHRWLLVSWSTRRFRAARLFTEIEILEPEAVAPNPNDYLVRKEGANAYALGADWQDARDRWKALSNRRKKRIAALMKQQLKEEKQDFLSALNGFLRSAFGNLVKGRLRALLGWVEERRPSFVQVDSFQDLDESRALIKRYFGILHSMGETDNKFVTTVRIEWGYLAPIFLITGLINRFKEEDGWKRIIDNYPALQANDSAYSKELRELRSFLFNCWLLWGPSVPHCTCTMWSTEGPDLTVQYGYGDENNSLDLIVKGGRSRDFLGALGSCLGSRSHGRAPSAVFAVPYNVTGQLRWGPSLDDREISGAQRLIQGGSGEMRKPLQGRVVLEASWTDCNYREEVKSSQYYSAYLWVMFVIVDSKAGQLFYEGQPWKNLLAYFEHGNIADPSTYQALKENLAAKICASLDKILEKEAGVAIGYVCAFDDSNCGAGNNVIFPSAGSRLVDLLQDRIARDSASLATAKREGRLFLPDTHPPAGPNPYGSCHLPETIEGFYRELDEAAAGAAAKDDKGDEA